MPTASGSYLVQGMYSGEVPITTTYCISQSGCSATLFADGFVHRAVVAGNVLTVSDATQHCELTFSGGTATERCTEPDGSMTEVYRGTLTARTLPGATSYGCASRPPPCASVGASAATTRSAVWAKSAAG